MTEGWVKAYSDSIMGMANILYKLKLIGKVTYLATSAEVKYREARLVGHVALENRRAWAVSKVL